MGHVYYEQDHDMNNTQRLSYFDNQFKKLLTIAARRQGVTVSALLSEIVDLRSFKDVLSVAFSEDASLSNYVGGLSKRGFELFFQRPLFQDIVKANTEDKPEKIEKIQIPSEVFQEKKKTRILFKATLKDRKTGKTIRTIAKKTYVVVKGKRVVRYRDNLGRFVKKT